MTPNAQLIGFILAVCIPSFTTLIGVMLFNARISDLSSRVDGCLADTNGRIADLRAHMDARFNAMDAMFTEKLRRVEEVMDARLTRIEEHLHLK